MQRPHVLALVLFPVGAMLVPSLWSRGSGILPDDFELNPPGVLNRQIPACGQCHRPFPGGLSLDIDVVLSARSLTPGQAIQVTTTSTGGQSQPGLWGGFSSDVDAGTFSAGPNSRVGYNGRGVTHQAAFQSNNRVWTYGYTAPAQPGPIDMFATVNTVNQDGRNDGSDFWGFHGYDAIELVPTPIRLYVNATGVVPVGDSCVGSYENFPVLGAQQVPSVGNSAFAVEVRGAAVQSPIVALLGPPSPPVDLGFLGASGCVLQVLPTFQLIGGTSAGVAIRSEGQAVLPMGIPNDNGLRGSSLSVQVAIVDVAAVAQGVRTLAVTLTNALAITVQ
jgi:hypothetical protein